MSIGRELSRFRDGWSNRDTHQNSSDSKHAENHRKDSLGRDRDNNKDRDRYRDNNDRDRGRGRDKSYRDRDYSRSRDRERNRDRDRDYYPKDRDVDYERRDLDQRSYRDDYYHDEVMINFNCFFKK